MDRVKNEILDPAAKDAGRWSAWARRAATAAILFHVAAVLAGAMAAPPSSDLQHELAEFFGPYHQLIDQGDAYRYYSTAFPPTPIVTATLSFADGRPEKVVRIPERGLRPRLRVQRQLAVAHGLMEDFEASKREHQGDGSKGPRANAVARSIGKANPGCSTVTLRLQMVMVPRIERVKEILDGPGREPVDLDDEEFTTAPERIGVYQCDAS